MKGFVVFTAIIKIALREIDSKLEQVSYLRKEKWKVSIKLKRYRQALSSQVGSDAATNTGFIPAKYGLTKRMPRGRPPKRPYQAIGNHYTCVCVCVRFCVCLCTLTKSYLCVHLYVFVCVNCVRTVCCHMCMCSSHTGTL